MGKRKNRPMGLSKRLRWEGTRNIIAFNWPFYLLVLVVVVVSAFAMFCTGGMIYFASMIALFVALYQLLASIFVSWWVYDASSFYKLSWLQKQLVNDGDLRLLNLSAGFDETTELIENKFKVSVTAADFFNAQQHTEPSIKRARLKYPPSESLLEITTADVGFTNNHFDVIVATFCLHEIRTEEELNHFLIELKRVLKNEGKFVLTEHFRDGPNFAAFSFGFLHFFTKKYWINAFEKAGFVLLAQEKHTVFVNHLIFKNGVSN